MSGNYFFLDGSSLTAQIRQLQRADPAYRGRKLCPKKFIEYFMLRLRRLHGGAYKRATFYFPTGDEVAIEDFILVPDHTLPGEVDDMHFKFCGQKLKKSAEFTKFVDENVPRRFQDRFQKSEKGVDTEICCDALRLATTGRLERLFLLSNDTDMIPLCRTLKEFGTNVSILHLSRATQPSGDLLREADSYNVVAAEDLPSMFLPLPEAPTEGVSAGNEATAEVPTTETSEKEPEKLEASDSDSTAAASLNADSDEDEDKAADNSLPKSN